MTASYWEGEKEQFNVKRFHPEVAQRPVEFITEHEKSVLEFATTHPTPSVNLQFDRRSNDQEDELIDLVEFIAVKGVAAMGNRLTPLKVKAIDRIEPEIPEEPEEEIEEPEDDASTNEGEDGEGGSETPVNAAEIESDDEAEESEDSEDKSEMKTDEKPAPKKKFKRRDNPDDSQPTLF